MSCVHCVYKVKVNFKSQTKQSRIFTNITVEDHVPQSCDGILMVVSSLHIVHFKSEVESVLNESPESEYG